MEEYLSFLCVNPRTGKSTELFIKSLAEDALNKHYGYSYAYPEGKKDVDEGLVMPFQNAKKKSIDISIPDFVVDSQTFKELLEETYFRIHGNSTEQKEEFNRLWGITKVDPKLAPIFGGFSNATTDINPRYDINYQTGGVAIIGDDVTAIRANRMDLTLMVPSIEHEWTHTGLIGKRAHNSVFFKEYFSILLERVSSIIVATQTNNDEVKRIFEIARTNHIISEMQVLPEFEKSLEDKQKIRDRYRFTGIDQLAERDCFILRSQMMQILTYFHSDLYAFAMVQKYLDDPQKFYAQIRKVMKGRMTAEEMNQYYGVSIKSREMLDMTERRLEDYR